MNNSINVRRPRRRVAGASIVAGVLALPLVAMAGPAAAPASAEAGAACATNGSSLSGFVATGTEPLSGATVTVWADPDLSKLKVGQAAGLVKLGEATTSSAGCFQIPAQAKWSRTATDAGLLDARVFVKRPDRLEMRVVPLTVTTAPSGARRVAKTSPETTGPAARKAAGVPVLERFTGTETVTTEAAASVAGDAAVASGRLAARAATETVSEPASAFVTGTAAARGSGGTRWVKRADYGKRPVLVGQWWSANPGVNQEWTYSKGASSALEAAFTLGGEGGKYKHSETTSRETNATVGFPGVAGVTGQYYRTYFKYGKFDLQEYDYIAGKWIYIGTWVRQTSWERGTDPVSGIPVPATKASNCSKYAKGSKDTTSTSTAMTWTDGVELSAAMKGVLGSVSLSSRTGFTSKATNYVVFKRRNGRLCGRSGPLSKPGALVARK